MFDPVLFILLWVVIGVATQFAWSKIEKIFKDVSIEDIFVGGVLGPLLTYSLIVVWIGLHTNVEKYLVLKSIYVAFYLPVLLFSNIENLLRMMFDVVTVSFKKLWKKIR